MFVVGLTRFSANYSANRGVAEKANTAATPSPKKSSRCRPKRRFPEDWTIETEENVLC
jgi:hypothetical protein